MKDGASVTGVFDFSKGYTQGSVFTMSSTVGYKELTCKKNTDGSKVTWTYGCGVDMLEGGWDKHILAPDALTNDIDINNQICWSVGNPEGNYTLNIGRETRMSSLVYNYRSSGDPNRKFIYEEAAPSNLVYTLPMPNRSQQIWNMDVTFPEITQDGYNGVKPQLTAALQQFPSVYQPEMILADQMPESENTIKRIVVASNNQLLDENSLQTLREYAHTYKLSQFTIKWYCAGTTHNTYQITIKAEGDPDAGEEIAREAIDLSSLKADYVAQDGDVLTGTLGAYFKISIANGAVVTLNGVTINGTNDEAFDWAGITCEGDATIVLADGSKNVVKGFKADKPGIYVPEGKTLII